MKNAKKGPFELSIDLEQIPSYRARFGSVDKTGGQINLKLEGESTAYAQDQSKNLREKLCSGQNQFSLPSVILRRKGLKV